MAFDILFLFNPWMILIISLVIVILILTILIGAEYYLYRKIEERIKAKKHSFEKYITRLNYASEKPEQELRIINETAKDFFKEHLGIEKDSSYSDLEEDFKKQKKAALASFSKTMMDILYSGERNKEDLSSLNNKLKSIIKNEENKTLNRLRKEIKDSEIRENIGKVKSKINSIKEAIKEKLKRNKQTQAPNSITRNLPEEIINYSKKDSKEAESQKQTKQKSVLVESEKPPQPVNNPKEKKPVNYPESEPPHYQKIRSLDDLDRIREKIQNKNN